MLGGSWGFLFSQSHVVVVTTPSVSDATSSAVGKMPVGSEEARSRAGLRPPLKLYVPISGIQLSR
jgi:hypothetical protein